MPRSPVVWFAPYVVVTAVHLVILAVPFESAQTPTKALLMPLLAVAFVGLAWNTFDHRGVRHEDRRLLWLVPVALFFSWLGDLALTGDGETWFLAGVGMFLVAQITYIVAFRSVGDPAVTRSRPWLAAPYVVWWVGLLAYFIVATGTDPLLIAVGVYGIALGAMAYLALRINVVVAIGAALFLVSDTLIGLNGFADVALPRHDLWVMSTYPAGQGLIVAGLLRHGRAAVTDPQEQQSGPAGRRADSGRQGLPPP